MLRNTGVAEVWAVGRRLTAHLERTARELAGVPSLKLDDPDPVLAHLFSSRMPNERHLWRIGQHQVGISEHSRVVISV